MRRTRFLFKGGRIKKWLCCRLGLLLLAVSTGSLAEGATPLSPELDARLRATLQARIDGILSTQTEIVKSDEWIPGETYTGTAYYVSPDGSNGWDGLTPETPKQTMKWVMEVSRGKFETILEPGDAVFFERGGVYRFDLSTDLFTLEVPRVTYSSYGEGAKPILAVSTESGVGGDKWLPVYGDEAGVKIWQFYRDMQDIAAVVLNDGEIYAGRVYEWWTGEDYESCEAVELQSETDQDVILTGALLPLQDSLTEDFRIISRPDLSAMPEGDLVWNQYQGPLYLRCDAGNPGELYASVEFVTSAITGIFDLCAPELVFDNLSFRCAGQAFFKNGLPTGDRYDATIQNCEFAYGGGCVTRYETWASGACFVGAQGDGIYNVANGVVLRNNYFHDINASVLTFEGDVDSQDFCTGSLQILDNVLVKAYGLRLDSLAENMRHFESVVIRGNQIWNAESLFENKYCYAEGSLYLMPWHHGEYVVADNVLYCTAGGAYSNALINTAALDEASSRVQYSGNTYVQRAGRNFAHNWPTGDISIEDPNLVERARDEIGGDSGAFYVIH